MKKLVRGILEFRNNVRPHYRETFARLALGQSPDALLVACSDSRVAPNLFASTEPGDLFVVRNVGNMVPPCEPEGRMASDASAAAAVEFAAGALRVADVIVCGHSSCGAMRALQDAAARRRAPHLDAWLRHAEAPLARVRGGGRMNADLALDDHLSQLNVLQQLEHVRSYPIVRERTAAGDLRLHAWWFDIASAEVLTYAEEAGRFVPIDEAEAERLIAGLEPR